MNGRWYEREHGIGRACGASYSRYPESTDKVTGRVVLKRKGGGLRRKEANRVEVVSVNGNRL